MSTDDRTPKLPEPSAAVIHISYGGPDRWLFIGGKSVRFEDHPHFGPIVLQNKSGDPAAVRPDGHHSFWTHWEAWRDQGKRTHEVGGKVWCVYETALMAKRKAAICKVAAPAPGGEGETNG